jgi:hypothetical protein
VSRKRGIGLLASLFAALAMTLGSTATAAQAAPNHHPPNHYPPPPPSLMVDKGVVRVGVTIHATGRMYTSRERVYITVAFRPKGWHRYRTVRRAIVRADRHGNFTYHVRPLAAGIVIIIARGQRSHNSASAVVHVIDRHRGGGWQMRPAANTGLIATGSGATVAAPPAESSSDIAGLTIAGLGVLALAGGAIITRQAIRRRRRP